ncbi:hypothetical protein ACJIZ3_003914 [Penstemon smallii]|uniref:Uncharacterized protein n=1 Tax=Penstemon smallii TaxID=265156 RepID=A0ABD3S0K0_9LAMI
MSDNNSGSENEDDRILDELERGRNQHVSWAFSLSAITNCLTWKPSYGRIPPTPAQRSSSVPNSPAPGQTSVPTTPAPGQTSVPTTPAPGQTSVPTTPAPGQTSVPTTPAPGQTSVSNTPDQPLVHNTGQTDPGQTHGPDPTPRRTRPMPQPEWWTPPPPPSFPATDLPPSSSSSTPIGIFSIFHS